MLRSAKKSIDRYLNHLMKEANVKSVGDLLPKEETTEVLAGWVFLEVAVEVFACKSREDECGCCETGADQLSCG